jgi:hypothetical protein
LDRTRPSAAGLVQWRRQVREGERKMRLGPNWIWATNENGKMVLLKLFCCRFELIQWILKFKPRFEIQIKV